MYYKLQANQLNPVKWLHLRYTCQLMCSVFHYFGYMFYLIKFVYFFFFVCCYRISW